MPTTIMLVHNFLLNSANKFPENVAIVYRGNRKTYSALQQEAFSLGVWLNGKDLQPGFRAAILSDNPFDYIASYFAILLAGGIVVGLNTQPTLRGIATVINDCTPSVIFIDEKFWKYLPDPSQIPSIQHAVIRLNRMALPSPENLPCTELNEIVNTSCNQLKDPPSVSPEDIAQIIYTSGTTGTPKGVMLRHSNLVANTKSTVEYLDLTENDRVMAVLPFFYSYGNSIMLTHFAAGGTLVVNQSFLYPNVILDEMTAEKVTGFSGVPSTFAILLNRSAIQNYSFPALRYITQAGAPMSPELGRRLSQTIPGVQIFIMYGQTEAAPRLSYLAPDKLYEKAGSIGKAIPGVTLTLLNKNGDEVPAGEVGEIVAQGDNIMAGYWQKPEETAKVLRAEGLWTGDLARQDEDGYFYIVSRKSDIIKSGSHRIGPKEIEEIILEHEAVHEAAVIGTPDEILGEAIMACIVLKEDYDCTEKEFTKHCRRNLPAFKVPHIFKFFDELPKTATGKIVKNKLMASGS